MRKFKIFLCRRRGVCGNIFRGFYYQIYFLIFIETVNHCGVKNFLTHFVYVFHKILCSIGCLEKFQATIRGILRNKTTEKSVNTKKYKIREDVYLMSMIFIFFETCNAISIVLLHWFLYRRYNTYIFLLFQISS